MLKAFSVTNYKCFSETLTLNFDELSDQDFSPACTKSWLVKTGIIIGNTGSGKTTMGSAIFDLVNHFMGSSKIAKTNLNHHASEATEFTYKFKFDSEELVYSYSRHSSGELIRQKILVGEKIFAEIDTEISYTATVLASESNYVQQDLEDGETSLFSCILENCNLDFSPTGACFKKFITFVMGMQYIDLDEDYKKANRAIEDKNLLEPLKNFLSNCGVHYELANANESEDTIVYCRLNGKIFPLLEVASPGVKKLINYFACMHSSNNSKAAFIYIDHADGLHDDAIHEIFSLAVESSAQAIVAISSTSLLNHNDVRPDCCFSLVDGKVKSFTKSTHKQLRPAHNLEKIYRGGGFK